MPLLRSFSFATRHSLNLWMLLVLFMHIITNTSGPVRILLCLSASQRACMHACRCACTRICHAIVWVLVSRQRSRGYYRRIVFISLDVPFTGLSSRHASQPAVPFGVTGAWCGDEGGTVYSHGVWNCVACHRHYGGKMALEEAFSADSFHTRNAFITVTACQQSNRHDHHTFARTGTCLLIG